MAEPAETPDPLGEEQRRFVQRERADAARLSTVGKLVAIIDDLVSRLRSLTERGRQMEEALGGVVLSRVEAAAVNRYAPPVNENPTTFSKPINVLISDSHKWGTDWEQTLMICQDAIARLYDAGYTLLAPSETEPAEEEP